MRSKMRAGFVRQVVLAGLLLGACFLPLPAQATAQAASRPTAEDALLYRLMAAKPEQFEPFLAQPDVYQIQILLTQVQRQENGRIDLQSHSYGLEQEQYFYPASAVKLPVAALALQKIYQLDLAAANRTCLLNTAYSSGYEKAQSGLSVAEYVRLALAESDNNAFHRLYNLLGVDELNQTLQGMGYRDTLIFRKFTETSARQDGATPACGLTSGGQVVYQQAARNIRQAYSLEGRGYANLYRGGNRKNFSVWNASSLADLQLMLRAVALPQTVETRQRFDLAESDRLFLLDCLRGEDFRHKYFIYGGQEAAASLPGLEIYNKTGTGYGNVLDNAYLVNREKNVEFFLSAVIYVNPNNIMGDNIYAYDAQGLPFLRDLGLAVYEYLIAQQEGGTE